MPVLRQTRKATNTPIGIARIGTGEAELWETISANARKISKDSFERVAQRSQVEAIDLAEAARTEDITTLDKTGKPLALQDLDSFNFNAQQAYKKVINYRFEESMNTELFTASEKLAVNAPSSSEYDREMSNYISSMVKNAPNNRYKNFIQDKGQNYLARTKITLIQNEKKAQIKESHDAFESNKITVGNEIYNNALSGSFINSESGPPDEGGIKLSKTNDIITENFKRLNALYDAKIITSEERINTLNEWKKIAADGALTYISKNVTTKNDIIFLSAFLETGDVKHLNMLPENIRNDAYAIQKTYMNQDNKSAINKTWNAKSDNINNVLIANDKLLQIEKVKFTKGVVVDSNNLIIHSLSRANIGTDEIGETIRGPATRTQINTIYSHFDNEYSKFKSEIDSVRSRITDTTADKQLEIMRRTITLPLISNYLIKNPTLQQETFIAAITTGDASSLNQGGKDLINFLKSSSVFIDEDRNWANEIVRAGTDEAKARYVRETNKLDVIESSKAFSGRLARGEVSAEEYQQYINTLQAGGFGSKLLMTATEVANTLAPLRESWSIGLFNKYLPDATEDELEALQYYLSGNGTSKNAFSEFSTLAVHPETGEDMLVAGSLELLGNAMTMGLSAKQVNTVNKEVSDRLTKLKVVNTEAKEKTVKQIATQTVLDGKGRFNKKTHRDAADEVLKENDIKWWDIGSLDDENLNIMLSTAGSQEWTNSLNDVINGRGNTSAEDIQKRMMALQWYARLNSRTDPSTRTVTRPLITGQLLGTDNSKYAKLDTIINISKFEGTENLLKISQDLANSSSNEVYQRNLISAFRDKDSKNNNRISNQEIHTYLKSLFGDSPEVADALLPYAKYHVYAYQNADNLEETLTKVAEELFVKTEYVIDPMGSLGDKFRSIHALPNVVPLGNTGPALREMNVSLKQYGDYQIGGKNANAYLVPNAYSGTVGVRYDVYVEEDNELVPLIVKKDGEMFLPAFEFNTGTDNDMLKKIEEYVSQDMESNEEKFKKLRDSARKGFVEEKIISEKSKEIVKERTNVLSDKAQELLRKRKSNLGTPDYLFKDTKHTFGSSVKDSKSAIAYVKSNAYEVSIADLVGKSLEPIAEWFANEKEAINSSDSALNYVRENAYESSTIAELVGKGLNPIGDRIKEELSDQKEIKKSDSILGYVRNNAYDSPTIANLVGTVLNTFKPKGKIPKRKSENKPSPKELAILKAADEGNDKLDSIGHASKETINNVEYYFVYEGEFAGNIYNRFKEKVELSFATQLWIKLNEEGND